MPLMYINSMGEGGTGGGGGVRSPPIIYMRQHRYSQVSPTPEGGTGGGRHGMKVGQGLRVQRREEILWEIWTRQCASLPGKAHVTDVTSTTELIKCVWKERGKTPC